MTTYTYNLEFTQSPVTTQGQKRYFNTSGNNNGSTYNETQSFLGQSFSDIKVIHIAGLPFYIAEGSDQSTGNHYISVIYLGTKISTPGVYDHHVFRIENLTIAQNDVFTLHFKNNEKLQGSGASHYSNSEITLTHVSNGNQIYVQDIDKLNTTIGDATNGTYKLKFLNNIQQSNNSVATSNNYLEILYDKVNYDNSVNTSELEEITQSSYLLNSINVKSSQSYDLIDFITKYINTNTTDVYCYELKFDNGIVSRGYQNAVDFLNPNGSSELIIPMIFPINLESQQSYTFTLYHYTANITSTPSFLTGNKIIVFEFNGEITFTSQSQSFNLTADIDMASTAVFANTFSQENANTSLSNANVQSLVQQYLVDPSTPLLNIATSISTIGVEAATIRYTLLSILTFNNTNIADLIVNPNSLTIFNLNLTKITTSNTLFQPNQDQQYSTSSYDFFSNPNGTIEENSTYMATFSKNPIQHYFSSSTFTLKYNLLFNVGRTSRNITVTKDISFNIFNHFKKELFGFSLLLVPILSVMIRLVSFRLLHKK